MSNPKTTPSAPKPVARDGWIRKSDLDAWLDRYLPIPTQAVSNEEFNPIPQTPEQKRVEHEIIAGAEREARLAGTGRRKFLRSSCGMALAFAAMNTVYGRCFRVDAAELSDPAAVAANKTRFFIFDVQTHHVAMPEEIPHVDKEFLNAIFSLREEARSMNPALKNRVPKPEDIYLENYVKEIFLDSETDVVALSALPGSTEDSDILTPDVIYKSRSWINEVTSSPRVISHGYFSPDLGQQNLEYMHSQLEKIKIEAWKGYTGWPRAKGVDRWRMDDEKLAYPALDFARKHGIHNICLHKGLPFPGDPNRWSPMDVPRAALDFPDMNFLVYHSGFRDVGEVLPAARDGFQKNSYIPWTSDLCAWKKKNPRVKNVYMEMGSTFAYMVSSSPVLAAYVIGMIIDAFGVDHVLWGTDSLWWGSPQWQIEAFRRLEMPEDLMKRFGWRPLTDDVKRQIFGLNAARVYGVDPEAKRNPLPGDYLEKLRKAYKQSGLNAPSNTQYGWVRADSLQAQA
jgi:predicted TIM-barrel fold metal-dependent hydrolase